MSPLGYCGEIPPPHSYGFEAGTDTPAQASRTVFLPQVVLGWPFIACESHFGCWGRSHLPQPCVCLALAVPVALAFATDTSAVARRTVFPPY